MRDAYESQISTMSESFEHSTLSKDSEIERLKLGLRSKTEQANSLEKELHEIKFGQGLGLLA